MPARHARPPMSEEPAAERRRRARRQLDDERFWRALKTERRVEERCHGPQTAAGEVATDPSAEPSVGPHTDTGPPAEPSVDPDPKAAQEARRVALRHLLEAAEARHERRGRGRLPVLASGARVRVSGGELAGRLGSVVDADYIESRVLLHFGGDEPPRWVPFARVGSIGGASED